MSHPEGGHPIFDPASDAARGALVKLALNSVAEARERDLAEDLDVGPTIFTGACITPVT